MTTSNSKELFASGQGAITRALTMVRDNAPHPGRSIKESCLDPLGLNVTEAAKVLGVASHTLSQVLNGHTAVSLERQFRSL